MESQASAESNDGNSLFPTSGMPLSVSSGSPRHSARAGSPILPDPEEAYKELRKRSFALVNKDREVFVSTSSFQRACDFLQRHQVVIIRGSPCTGKTATGLSLLRHFAVKGFAPLVLHNVQEWRNHVRRNRKQSVLLDCVFGEVRVAMTKYVEWTVLFSRLTAVLKENPNCLLVITLHPHIMAKLDSMAQPQAYFHDTPLVDLDDATFTPQEKEEMLKKHLARNKLKLDPQAVCKIISDDISGPAFPSCCGNYVRQFSKGEYINLRYNHEVFSWPGLVYVQFFSAALHDSENWEDLVPLLILAASQSGFVLGQEEQIEMKLRILGIVTIDVDMEGVQAQAAWLKGSILSTDMKQFKNRDLSDGFSFALFRNNFVELLLNACSTEFLVKHVHIEPTSRNTDIIIDSTSPYFPRLMQRICQEILSGNLVQISQHPALQNGKFLDELKAYLLEKNRCLKALMSAQDHRHNMPLLYWSAWSYSGALTCWCLSQLPTTYDGRVVRRTFLTCNLFGEKVNSLRMARMFDWLCEKKVMNDAVSDIFLPVPAPEDRLCEEVKAKSHKVLSGPNLLTWGFSGNTIPWKIDKCQTNTDMFIPKRIDDSGHPGCPKAAAEATSINTSPLTPPAVPSTHGASVSPRHVLPSPPGNGLTMSTITQYYDLPTIRSGSSSSSSGSYISIKPVSALTNQADIRQTSTLLIISENDNNEDAGTFPCRTDDTRASGEAADTPGLDRERSVEREMAGNSLSTELSEGVSTLLSVAEGHLRSGKPLPPSIVKISVKKEEGEVVLQPICARWYTFLRLVSMAEVDDMNHHGYTLLHTAAHNGEINIVQFLVDSGADLASLTHKGNTALSKAVDRNQFVVAAYLLGQGWQRMPTSPTSTAGTSGRDLSWMFGTRKLYDIFSKIVQKRRDEMLCLLFRYGIQVKDPAEMESLLEEASSVDDNDKVISLLKQHRDQNTMVMDEDDEDNYSVPESPAPTANVPDAGGEQKHSKGLKFFFRK